MVKALAGKPVKFLGVGADMSPAQALKYQRETGLAMPIFADNLGLMQARYGFKISLKNIWQSRIIYSGGMTGGTQLTKEPIDRALAQSRPQAKFQNLDVDAKLVPVCDLLEFGQYAAGAKQLAQHRKSSSKGVQQSVTKIQSALNKEGEAWKTAADAAVTSDPIAAYDLYGRLVTVFPADDLGKEGQKALKTLAKEKAVKSELSARAAYDKVSQAMSVAAPPQRPALAKAFHDVARKHPNTPTGEKAKSLAQELETVTGK